MSLANRVDPRAKQLKDHFAAINQSPRSAGQSPLLSHQSLERLTAALHINAERLASSPDEQVRQVGQALMLSIFIAEYKQETRDVALLQGLLIFWHSYLDPISAAQPAPSIASVTTYCADMTNARAFLHQAKRWLSSAYAHDMETLRALNTLLSSENFGKIVISGLPHRPSDSERRTFGNYLNAAARVMAVRLESLVPELFQAYVPPNLMPDEPLKPHDKAVVPMRSGEIIHVSPPAQALWIAGWMANVSGRLPGLRQRNLPAACFVERRLQFQSLRGQPRTPAFLTGTDAEAKGMSGFVVGELGSGRTAFLKSLARLYAAQFLRQHEGIVPFYFSAGDFVIHARNRRSIHEFIADRLLSFGGETAGIEELPDLLRALDRAGKLLFLMDDLDQLSEADQSEVLAQLTFSPAVLCAALSWQVERLAQTNTRAHLGVTSFALFTAQEQLGLIEHVAAVTDCVYDGHTARELLRELPSLAQSPLGLMIILDELARDWTDLTRVTSVALDEFCRRAGLPLAPFGDRGAATSNEWVHLQSAAFDLLFALQLPDGYASLNGQYDVTIVREMVENPQGYAWRQNWEQVKHSGLFRPVTHATGEALALIHRDLTYYLLAHVARQHEFTLQWRERGLPPKAVAILEQVTRHLENLKNPRRRFDIRYFTPLLPVQLPPKSKPKSWGGFFPKLFRMVS